MTRESRCQHVASHEDLAAAAVGIARRDADVKGETVRLFRAVDLAAVGDAAVMWHGHQVTAGRLVAWRDGPALVAGATTPLDGQLVPADGRLGSDAPGDPAEGTTLGNLEFNLVGHGEILAQPLRPKLLHFSYLHCYC